MLIERYDLDVFSPPCDPGSERWSAFARLGQDISEAMPYLNTLWKNAIYDHENHTLTLVRGGRRYTLRPFEIAISNLEDRDEAQRVADRVIGEVNRTWDRRHEIVPNYDKRRQPTVMEIYKILPGGNCRQCGEATCFIFAAKLIAGQTVLDRCVRLFEAEFAGQRNRLEQMLGIAVE
jgi:ArsR family metal-binding transcriptional regulator